MVLLVSHGFQPLLLGFMPDLYPHVPHGSIDTLPPSQNSARTVPSPKMEFLRSLEWDLNLSYHQGGMKNYMNSSNQGARS